MAQTIGESMTSPSAARADGEAYLERTKPLGPEPMGTVIIEARRVVTALLEALRETGFDDLTPKLSDAEKVWKCRNCGVEQDSHGPVTDHPPAAARPEPSRDGTPGPWHVEPDSDEAGNIIGWWVINSYSAHRVEFTDHREALAVRDALNGEARPALTVERLAELLVEASELADRGGICREDRDIMAAWLLPHLAGPAQEGK